MRRNPFGASRAETVAVARREAATGAQRGALPPREASALQAGEVDADSGAVVRYGLFDVTPWGSDDDWRFA